MFNRREDALERFIAHFESKGEEDAAQGAADPTEGMEPEEALHFHILRRRKDGVEDWIDRSVEKIGAVPTLNEVLLPAMKEVGDKFGAGELILPFVLQSAEVMKRAVAQLEKYLDKIEGYTKGTVVLATVFGDVHDIGKSLVNTILTNNGYTVVDLGKQVPIQTIVDAAAGARGDRDRPVARCSSRPPSRCPRASRSCTPRASRYPVLIGGAAINRAFSYRALYPGGKESEEIYEPGVFYCKDAFEGLAVMDQLIDADARAALVEKLRAGATAFREKGEEPEEELNFADDSVRSAARTDAPIPDAAVLGRAGDPGRHGRGLPPPRHARAVQAALGRARRQRRGVAEAAATRTSARAWSGCGASRTYLHPRALLGFFPCYALGNDIVVLDPEDRETELTRFVCPRQPKGDRICLADFFRPAVDGKPPRGARRDRRAGGDGRLRGDRADGASWRPKASSPSSCSCTASACRPPRAWPSGCTGASREMLGIPAAQGRRYSWGYPAVPEQSEHLKVEKLLDLEQIGMTITDGYAPDPEQSTLALVAHHPQAIYFGTRQGRLLPDGSPDDLIRGSSRDPSLFGELDDAEPPEGAVEGEDEPAMAGEAASGSAARWGGRVRGRRRAARCAPGVRDAVLRRHLEHLLGRQRPREVEALAEVAVHPLQACELLGVLDALGDRFEVEDPRELDDRGRHLLDLRVGVGEERAVDLEDVDGQLAHVVERGVAGAEVVDRQFDAELAQRFQAQQADLHVLHHHALGQLQREARRDDRRSPRAPRRPRR